MMQTEYFNLKLKQLAEINELRNLMAHHEPIL